MWVVAALFVVYFAYTPDQRLALLTPWTPVASAGGAPARSE